MELEVSTTLEGEYYYTVDECPYCGKDNGEFDEESNHANTIWVVCTNCWARGPTKMTYQAAADAWNTRK